MRKIVIDASVILSYILPDEKIPSKIKKVFNNFIDSEVGFMAPTLLKLEVANALRSAVVQKRIRAEIAKKILAKFLELKIQYSSTANVSSILEIALKNKLSVYDATYLYLSKKENAQLLSLDKKLAKLAE